MTLDLRRLILGESSRLRYVNRYSTCRVHCPENVAQHSFFVAFYSMMICRWWGYKNDLTEVEIQNHLGKVLVAALMHDVEESISGDIPRPFKYSSKTLRNDLHSAGEQAARMVLNSIFTSEVEACNLFDEWNGAKNIEEIHGRIVSLSDLIAVVSYMYQEVLNGNKDLYRQAASFREHCAIYKDSAYDDLRGIIVQVDRLVDELQILSGHPFLESVEGPRST